MSSTPKFLDRMMESSSTTGTGTYTLAGAITGFQSFAALGDGNSCYYCAQEVDANGNPSGGWEVGLGTYTSSGTTLSRDSVKASSNAGAAVNWGAGTRRIFLCMPAYDTARQTLVDVYTATGANTWTKPNGAKSVFVQLISGGGGGGAGRRGAAGTNRCGGTSAQAGGYAERVFPASVLGATETATVGAKGTGGAAQTADSTNGANGTDGGDTSFGAWLKAPGGLHGIGGDNSTFLSPAAFGGVASLPAMLDGTSVASAPVNSSNSTGSVASDSPWPPAAGGSGGGLDTANTASSGGKGGDVKAGTLLSSSVVSGPATAITGGAAGTAGGAGSNGGGTTANHPGGGAGGGGGASAAAAAGGAGGNGGIYGASGAGGGASANGNNSGKGGDGADGIVIVTTFF